MEDKGRGAGGKTALHVLAFIGVTVLLLALSGLVYAVLCRIPVVKTYLI